MHSRLYIMKKLISFLFLILCLSAARAQKSIQYFPPVTQAADMDNIRTVIQDRQYIYIGANAFYRTGNSVVPAVVKTDTSGKVVWSYTLNMETDTDSVKTQYYSNWLAGLAIESIFIDSSNVYVYLNRSLHNPVMLAIDSKTGNLLWRAKYTQDPSSYILLGGDAGAEDIFLMNGSTYELVSKKTGKTRYRKTMFATSITVDKDGTTYVSQRDSVKKYTSPMLDALIWQTKITPLVSSPVIKGLVPQSDGYLYCYGTHGTGNNRPFYSRLSKSDGSINWVQKPTLFLETSESCMRIKDDYIYFTGRPTSSTSSTGFHATKLKRTDGTLIWDKVYDTKGIEQVHTAGYSALNYGDVDDNGNLYASGYQDFGDAKLGKWVVCKFNANGKLIYHEIVKDTSNITGEDVGKFTFFLDHRIYHIGLINTGGQLGTYLVSTDTSATFNTLLKKHIPLNYQDGGTIKSIAQLSFSTYLIYKQSDREVVLEARKTMDNALLWSRTMGGRPYTKADRLSLYKGNDIAVTALAHGSAQSVIDYTVLPDSILLFQYDSSGKAVNFRHLSRRGLNDFKSMQLLFANKSSVLYVMAGRNFGEYMKSYKFNMNKADENLSLVLNTTISYKPYAGYKILAVPYLNDSTVSFYDNQSSYDRNISAETDLFNTNNTDNNYGVSFGTSKSLKTQNARFENLSPFDSSTVLVLADDGASGNRLIIKYNIQQDTVLWIQEITAAITLHNASSINKSTYCMGNRDNALVVLKLDNTTGVPIWEKTVSPAGANQYYVPLDQQINPYLQQYTICGYIADTTLPVMRKYPFYVSFDPSGKIVQQWTGIPDFVGDNQLNTISVNQYGQTLIGGSHYTLANGKAAVLITGGDKLPPVDVVTLQACTGSNLTLTSTVSGQSYQWQMDKGFGFEDLTNQTASLLLSNISLPEGTYYYRCLADGISNRWFKLETAVAFTPVITVHGDTLVKAGTVAALTADVKFGGSQPAFQWEDSTAQHGWTVIPGAVNNTLMYTPATMKNKVRCTVSSSLGCVVVNGVKSEAFPVNIDPVTAVDPTPVADYGIHFYPNPVTTELTIQMESQWKTVEIFQLGGKSVYTQQLKNQTKVSIPVNQLSAGIYVVVMTRKSGVPVSFKFIRL